MALVQKNAGTANGSASLVTSLGSATTAGNTILIFANGAGTITTPSGFVSRSPQVNNQGLYIFEKLVASGNSSDTPTLTMSGAYNATWQIAEYSGITAFDVSSGNFSNAAGLSSWNTPSITPTTGARLLVGFIAASNNSNSGTFSAGDPQLWINSFTSQQSTTRTGTTGSGRDSMVGGWADRSGVTGNGSTTYSTGAGITSSTGVYAPASIIASYKVSAGGGSQSLTPSKYTNNNTFYAPTVARGARTLTPSLFSNSATFYAPLVKSRYTLTPAKYTDADSFYSATVSRGARNLTPSLFNDGDTFYSPTVGRGSVSLHPSLFADGDTFYSPTVTQGPITLRPGLFVDTDAFYSPTVGRGSVSLSPSRYVDPDAFYSAAVTTVYRLSPAKFTDSDTFYAPVVGRGSVTLFPPFLNDADSFYPPTVEGGSPATQSLLPELFIDADTFYAPRVEGGAQESAIDQHDGLGPRRVEYVQRTPRRKRLDEQIHDAVERALQRIEHGAHLTAKEAVQVERVVESIAEQATVANLPDMSGLVAALDDVGKALTKLERKRNLERLQKYEEDLEDEHAAMLLLS